MSRSNHTLASTLERLCAVLDRDLLVEPAALSPLVLALERALPSVPARVPGLADLVKLTLHALRALQDGTVMDETTHRDAVRSALESARRCLTRRNVAARQALVNEAGRAMFAAAGWEPTEWTIRPLATNGASESDAQTALFLDDAALLLMQLEPGDADGLARVRRVLEQLAVDRSYPAAVRDLTAAAALGLAATQDGTVEAAEAVARASEALEDAMRQMRDRVAGAHASRVSPARHSMGDADGGAAGATLDMLPAAADVGLLRDFVVESREFLDDAETALLVLEVEPGNAEAINTVFRAVHTIKGSSAFLGLQRLADLAHHAESLLDRIRTHEIRCTGGYADLALSSVDVLKGMVASIEAALDGAPLVVPDGYEPLLRLLAAPEAAGVASTQSDVTRAALGLATTAPRPGLARRTAAPREASLRVRTSRLDRLIDLVGELVIAQSMIAQDDVVRHGGHHELSRTVGHSGKLIRELHDLSMSMRMVPLRALFQKMTRLVRDLAQKTGKQVELTVDGEDTEIDRHLVDIVADPLLHMTRNAVDHGIEPPDQREALGKPRVGTVRITARHVGGNVMLELEDDGQGLDPDRIARKAVALGLVDPDRVLTSREAFELIFTPGFSTAEVVTDVSGRGVGLDVVRRNIEALRGRIEIDSRAGRGTRFSLRLPLTLAITDGMLVRVGQERYIVPTVHIQLSFRPERSMLSTIAGRGELVMLRGEPLPIVRLHRLFGVEDAVTDPTQGLLMIVGDGERRSALFVDELLGQQQVVAKPLGDGVGMVPGLSGGAILGDGRVGLILDVGAVVAIARHAPPPRKAPPSTRRSVA